MNKLLDNQIVKVEYVETVIRMISEGVHERYTRDEVITLLESLIVLGGENE